MPEQEDDRSGSSRSQRRVASGLIADQRSVDDVPGVVGSLQRLCRAVAIDLSQMGAAVSLMSEGGSQGVAAGSDERAEHIDELQFSLGEGPCRDAFAARRPVLASDLSSGEAARWPGYALAARSEGVAATYSFPLHVGAAALGVLDIFADRPGLLSDDQLAMALTFAEIATEIIIDGGVTPTVGDLDPGLESVLGYRAQIYQAQGIVMVELGVSLPAALARLRAHAFVQGQDLADLAEDVIAGRVHLDADRP